MEHVLKFFIVYLSFYAGALLLEFEWLILSVPYMGV